MTAVRKSVLSRIIAHDFTKELKQFEFEVKFDIRPQQRDSLACLRKVEQCFIGHQQFMLCKIKGGDKLITRVSFYTKGNSEYTLFTYRGARMLKVKKHRIIRAGGLSIFKSDERLLIDRRDFMKYLEPLRHRFKRHSYRLVKLDKMCTRLQLAGSQIGWMVKTRVKDFIFDPRDGRIYAVAVTFCKSGGRVQKQLEVEYAGYIPGFRDRKKNNEKQIISRTLELSRCIYHCVPQMLMPSIERKYEFVRRVCCDD